MPKRATLQRIGTALVLALGLGGIATQGAQALDEPKVPEQVGAYFATGLVPRLADLYGPGAKAGTGIDFDAMTKVGGIRRVLSWTDGFLAGTKTDAPTELTNNWVAPVTIKVGVVAGLATVWINPANDLPELADFEPGLSLVDALAKAPASTLLIRDDEHSAWFATDGTTITPLVAGTSGVTSVITPAAYQAALIAAKKMAPDAAAPAKGLLVAGIVLGLVVVILAVFILLPDRRRRARKAADTAGSTNSLDTPSDSVHTVTAPAAAKPTVKPAARAKSATSAKPGAPGAKQPTVSPTAAKTAVPQKIGTTAKTPTATKTAVSAKTAAPAQTATPSKRTSTKAPAKTAADGASVTKKPSATGATLKAPVVTASADSRSLQPRTKAASSPRKRATPAAPPADPVV